MTEPIPDPFSRLLPGNIQYGCYQLHLKLKKTITLQVGSLCRLDLKAGFYIYTGRHKKYLAARINRHLQKKKTLYWHIDYFTNHPAISMDQIIIFPQVDAECMINKDFQRFFNSHDLYPGLGSGDCVESCKSHMQFMPTMTEKLIHRWIKLHSDKNPVILTRNDFIDRNTDARVTGS